MKRTCMMLVALALIFGLAQCKKNNETNTTNEGEKVFITLNVSKGNNSRLDVDPPHVNFENGDVIHVASNGVYVGSLEYNGTNFSGEISGATEDQPLYFYLLGNVIPTETLTAGTTTTCSVNISDQTGDLPVIACAPSDQDFGATTTFTATLRNKCALVKFNVTTASSSATCMTGFKNKVTVTFGSTDMAYTKEGNGLIKLAAGSGERWAILLPQVALEEGTQGSASTEDQTSEGSRPAIPEILENAYLTTGIAVTVFPQGAIRSLFSVNSDGGQVFFSQGNLQFIGSAATPYWKFADHQWDYLGTTTDQNSDDENVDRDLFAWGTSGYNHGAVYYQPWNFNHENGYEYNAYGGFHNNLYDQTGKADWGYNAIRNGGNTEGQWRTLTKDEWDYVINSRPTFSGIRYVQAKVGDVNGIVLLPNDWDASTYDLNDPNGGDYTSNTITAVEWTNTLEANGAVFLPAAGMGGHDISYLNRYGYCWSSSKIDGYGVAFLCFGDGLLTTSATNYRYFGHSVRLVQDVQ